MLLRNGLHHLGSLAKLPQDGDRNCIHSIVNKHLLSVCEASRRQRGQRRGLCLREGHIQAWVWGGEGFCTGGDLV
jgi:hypothetical protein